MTYYESQQQHPMHNPQAWAAYNLLNAQTNGLSPAGIYGNPWMQGGGFGQAAYGQQYGQSGYLGQPSVGGFGQSAGWGGQPAWWGQQRQLTQQDVSEVVRQLLPVLPHVFAQAQQPQAAIGYAAYGQPQRMLTQQDVNEVVRQILPILPQIAATLQGQPHLQHAAIHGGHAIPGFANIATQNPFAQSWLQQQQPFGQPWAQPLGQYGWPQMQAAFGGQPWGHQQRQLSQQDLTEVVRQLVSVIPQVIGNLQAYGQQRMN
jgi:hypothetical protein